MKTVARYAFCNEYGDTFDNPIESPEGAWVKHSDYEALRLKAESYQASTVETLEVGQTIMDCDDKIIEGLKAEIARMQAIIDRYADNAIPKCSGCGQQGLFTAGVCRDCLQKRVGF